MDAGQAKASRSYVEHYLSPLRSFLTDENVNEIVINPDGAIFVEYATAHHMKEIDLKLDQHAIFQLGSQLAGETKNTLGKDHPIVSGRVFVWGAPLRVQVVIPPAIDEGVSLSIRKYVSRILKPTEIKYVIGKPIDVEYERRASHRQIRTMAEEGHLERLLRLAVDQRLNILISGGTSSGKTTMARALLAMSDQNDRIVTIEDAQELHPPHKNQVALVADRKEGSERLPAKLLESALRMRPDRLILGEIRGVEAYNFLEAINTGHPGSITTIHADSPALALDRLALMVMRTGMQLGHSEIIRYAKQTIDLVIQVGRRDGERGVFDIELPSLTRHA